MAANTIAVPQSAYEVSFLDAVKIRRSTISLAKESPISDDRIVLLVNHAIKHAPSPFNVQSCRVLILLREEHDKLWDIGLEACKKNLPAEVNAVYEPKLKEYQAAYGTVVFLEDPEAIKKLPQPLQDLSAQFPEWNEHSNAMCQYIAWTALSVEGLGCSLQHIQTHLSAGVQATWNVPKTWNIRAQLVFGKPTGPPRGGLDKQFAPLEGRSFVYGKQ